MPDKLITPLTGNYKSVYTSQEEHRTAESWSVPAKGDSF